MPATSDEYADKVLRDAQVPQKGRVFRGRTLASSFTIDNGELRPATQREHNNAADRDRYREGDFIRANMDWTRSFIMKNGKPVRANRNEYMARNTQFEATRAKVEAGEAEKQRTASVGSGKGTFVRDHDWESSAVDIHGSDLEWTDEEKAQLLLEKERATQMAELERQRDKAFLTPERDPP